MEALDGIRIPFAGAAGPISENSEADDGCRHDRNTPSRLSPRRRGGRYFYDIGYSQTAG